jgi:hypothetical protein
MTPAKPHILVLACETRFRIYDYVFSDAGDQRLEVTLDHNDKIHFHNGPTILNLMCASKRFREEIPDQLFTFVLTDDQRSCRPIVAAFFRALGPDRRNLVRRLAITFFTIRSLFDPALFQYPHDTLHDERLRPGTTKIHLLPPYVAALDPLWIRSLPIVQGKLFGGINHTTSQYLPRMENLVYLELGVDVLELLLYHTPDVSRVGSAKIDTRSLSENCANVSSGRRQGPNLFLAVFDMLSHMDHWKDLHVRVLWRDFLVDRYRAAGASVDGTLTADVKTEMRGLFLDLAKQRVKQRGPVKTFDDDVE